jgi:nucleotide-binding universal stress UspA family protein
MYQKIVAALDFSENNGQVLGSALKLANNDASKLHLIHVVQPITEGYALNVYSKYFLALEEEALESATEQLAKIAETANMLLHGAKCDILTVHATETSAIEKRVCGSPGLSGTKV